MSLATPQQQGQTKFFFLPGWVVSLLFHAGLLILLTVSLKSCSSGTEGAGEGEMREIGIYLKSKNTFNQPEPDENNSSNQSNQSNKQSTSSTAAGKKSPDIVDPTPPVPFATLDIMPSHILGGGTPVPTFPEGSNTGTPFSNGGVRKGGGSLAGGRPGETSFIGLRDQGKSFVFLIDCSGSMANHGALQVAKAEVMASLAGLKSGQKFQVIFFNERQYIFRKKNESANKLYLATDINKILANQFISSIQADLGTERMSSIRRALAMNAEVLFLLTDADGPLSSRKMAEIKKMNKSKTRIHCIEFGKGAQLIDGNYLKRIAYQNKGSYGYRDIRKFDR